jgi:hypothetical protein
MLSYARKALLPVLVVPLSNGDFIIKYADGHKKQVTADDVAKTMLIWNEVSDEPFPMMVVH